MYAEQKIIFNDELLGLYWGHVLAYLGCVLATFTIYILLMPVMGQIFNKETFGQNRKQCFILTYWDPIGAMFGPYQGHVLAICMILDFEMPEMANILPDQ